MENDIEELNNTIEDKNSEINELNDKMKKADELKITLQGNAKQVEIFESEIEEKISRYSDDILSNDKVLVSPQIENYDLGCYYDDNIQKYVKKLTDAISSVISKGLDSGLRINDITITFGEIIGKADGYGSGEKLGYYKNEMGIINCSYYLEKGYEGSYSISGTKTFNSNISPYFYYNYELAFLRAYSVYYYIKNALNGFGISTSEPALFKVIEYKEKGSEYRGIDLTINIKGMLKHYQREISNLVEEIKKIDAELQLLVAEKNKLQEQSDKMEILYENVNEEKIILKEIYSKK